MSDMQAFRSSPQVGLHRTKLNTLITFPVRGLDMSSLVAEQHLSGENGCRRIADLSPWQPNRRSQSYTNDSVYDMYAVCNHYGNMQGGHYTGLYWIVLISNDCSYNSTAGRISQYVVFFSYLNILIDLIVYYYHHFLFLKSKYWFDLDVCMYFFYVCIHL